MNDAAAPCPPEFLALADRLVAASGAVIRRYYRTPVAVDAKADQSPVTIADREAEAAIRAILAEERPQDGIHGEEYGIERPDARYVWVLDPIDGTKAFITGRPLFGTLVALLRDGAPILGIIDQPVLGDRWTGALGRQTIFNGAPASTRRCPRLADAILNATSPDMFTGPDKARFDALKEGARITTYGGDCYGFGLVASGYIDLTVEANLQFYDFAALAPIVIGAGGRFTDWEGRPVGASCDGRVIAAGDPDLHAEALKRLT
ncbi:histidinol-phosphatase [Inquilinus sp. CAU 1745]|uniref:histidinol-phosphatase n=1 Tax=Inquilinus sp. CAU 1745 TaxID=3140369 RepID=UPI00325AE844